MFFIVHKVQLRKNVNLWCSVTKLTCNGELHGTGRFLCFPHYSQITLDLAVVFLFYPVNCEAALAVGQTSSKIRHLKYENSLKTCTKNIFFNSSHPSSRRIVIKIVRRQTGYVDPAVLQGNPHPAQESNILSWQNRRLLWLNIHGNYSCTTWNNRVGD